MLARQAPSAARRHPPPPAAFARAPRRAARVVAFREEDAKRRADQARQGGPAGPSPKESPLDINAPQPVTPAAGPATHPTGRNYTAIALALAAGAVGVAMYPQQVIKAIFGGGVSAASGSLNWQVARLLSVGMAVAAATNAAESRAGGRAGGAVEPVLEADTTIRLDRSLAAFGLLTLVATALAYTPLAARVMPGYVSGSALLHPYAAAALAVAGALQWWVAGLASPFEIIKSLGRELWGTPSRVNNFNAATYALLGAAFVSAGVACMLFPAQTMAGVFGARVAATAGPQAALMWQLVGAGISCCVGGACYALKEGAGFRDLTETKFKWLNIGLGAGAVGHMIMMTPLVLLEGGPLAPVIMAVFGLTMVMGTINSAA